MLVPAPKTYEKKRRGRGKGKGKEERGGGGRGERITRRSKRPNHTIHGVFTLFVLSNTANAGTFPLRQPLIYARESFGVVISGA